MSIGGYAWADGPQRTDNPSGSIFHGDLTANTIGYDSITNWDDAVISSTLSTGVESHEAGSDASCKVTRNSGDITKIDIAECEVHIQGAHYELEATTLVDPGFGVGEGEQWIGVGTSGIVKQQGKFSNAQKRTIMPIARIQAKVGQTGSGSDISDLGVFDHRYLIAEDGYRNEKYLSEAIGALFVTGGLTTESSTALQLDFSAGGLYDSDRMNQTWDSFANLSGLHVYHDSGAWTIVEETLLLDDTNYDNGTDLTAMQNNNYHCSNTLLMTPRGTQDAEFSNVRFFLIHCQSQHSDLQDAIDSGIDFGPFTDQHTSGLVPVAQILVKKNDSNIVSIIDARPRIGFAGGSITTAAITLQGAYNNSSPGSPEIVLNAAQNGFTISDSDTPVGDVFKINNFNNTTSYLFVDPNEVVVPDGMFAQFGNHSGAVPLAADCNADSEWGRQYIDTDNNRLYICNGASRGWDYISLTD
jgi:hypothetical protein